MFVPDAAAPELTADEPEGPEEPHDVEANAPRPGGRVAVSPAETAPVGPMMLAAPVARGGVAGRACVAEDVPGSMTLSFGSPTAVPRVTRRA